MFIAWLQIHFKTVFTRAPPLDSKVMSGAVTVESVSCILGPFAWSAFYVDDWFS